MVGFLSDKQPEIHCTTLFNMQQRRKKKQTANLTTQQIAVTLQEE
jgi:hypothetical protein